MVFRSLNDNRPHVLHLTCVTYTRACASESGISVSINMSILTPNDDVFRSHTQNADGNTRYGVLVSWNAVCQLEDVTS